MDEIDILKLIYPPNGDIPFQAIQSGKFSRINSRIKLLMEELKDKPPILKEESLALTRRMVELRDKGKTWVEISLIMGMSSKTCEGRVRSYKRNRQPTEAKSQPDPASEPPPRPLPPQPAIAKPQPTLTSEMHIEDAFHKEGGKKKEPKIPHTEDDFICGEREKGRSNSEIRKALESKGIVCADADVSARYILKNFSRMTTVELGAELCRVYGGTWTPEKVRERLKELKGEAG
jgi:hypothetical protein